MLLYLSLQFLVLDHQLGQGVFEVLYLVLRSDMLKQVLSLNFGCIRSILKGFLDLCINIFDFHVEGFRQNFNFFFHGNWVAVKITLLFNQVLNFFLLLVNLRSLQMDYRLDNLIVLLFSKFVERGCVWGLLWREGLIILLVHPIGEALGSLKVLGRQMRCRIKVFVASITARLSVVDVSNDLGLVDEFFF